MADIKITDLVDQSAFDSLTNLSKELESLKDKYTEIAKELVKGIKINVEVVGDLDKLDTLIATKAKEAADTTSKLNSVVKQQGEIIANTTNTISRQLAEQEKENAKVRESWQENEKWQKVANDVLGTRDQNLIRLADTEKSLKDVAKATKELEEREKNGQISAQDYTTKRANLLEQERTLKTAKSELTNILTNEEKLNQASAGSYQRLSLELERMKKAYKQLTEEEKASPAGKALSESIGSYDARLKDLASDMGEFQRNVGNYAIAGQSMKAQLREMVETIAMLTLEYRQLSEAEKNDEGGVAMKAQIDELTAKASVLKDAISDVKESVTHGASDTAAFQGITQGVNLMISGMSTATGVAKMLGLSEEDLIAVQTKMQVALVASNFLTQAQAAIQKQSYLMKGVAAIQTKALTVAEELETAAKGKGVIATVALTAAQRVFNAVAKANPYVLLASVILGVVAAVWGLTKANKSNAESEKGAQEAAEKRQRQYEDFRNTVSQSVGAQIAAYMKIKKAWEQLGDSFAAKKKFIDENKKAFQDLGYSVNSVNDAEKILKERTQNVVAAIIARAKAAAYQNEITKTYEDLIKNQIKAEQDTKNIKKAYVGETVSKEQAENLEKRGGKVTKDVVVNTKTGSTMTYYSIADKFTTKLVEADRAQDTLNKRLQMQNNSRKDAEEKLNFLNKELDKAIDDVNKNTNATGVPTFNNNKDSKTSPYSHTDSKDTLKSEEELQRDLLKLRQSTIKKQLEYTEKGTQEECDLRKEYAENQATLDIEEVKKSYKAQNTALEASFKAGKISQEEYDREKTALSQNEADTEKAIENKKNKEITELDENLTKAKEAEAKKRVDAIENQAAGEQAILNAQYNKDYAKLTNKYAKDLKLAQEHGKDTTQIEETYNKEKEALDNTFAKDTINNSISVLENILRVENLSADEREKIERELMTAKADLAKEEADQEKKAIEDVVKADDKGNKKRKMSTQDWLNFASQSLNSIADLASSIYDNKISQIEAEEDANSNAYGKEVESIESLADHGVITEEEAEARKRAAKIATEKKEEELEKKKAELKYKQAIMDKANSIAQAGIATAVAINQALPNVILAALVGAMGAVQLATILATPISKYARGTDEKGHRGGLAMVGDGGKHEVVMIGDKVWITPKTPTLVDMPIGAMVYPDADKITDNIDPIDMVNIMPISSAGTQPKVIVNNDYKNLERGISQIVNLQKMQIKKQHEISYLQNYERYKISRL